MGPTRARQSGEEVVGCGPMRNAMNSILSLYQSSSPLTTWCFHHRQAVPSSGTQQHSRPRVVRALSLGVLPRSASCLHYHLTQTHTTAAESCLLEGAIRVRTELGWRPPQRATVAVLSDLFRQGWSFLPFLCAASQSAAVAKGVLAASPPAATCSARTGHLIFQ